MSNACTAQPKILAGRLTTKSHEIARNKRHEPSCALLRVAWCDFVVNSFQLSLVCKHPQSEKAHQYRLKYLIRALGLLKAAVETVAARCRAESGLLESTFRLRNLKSGYRHCEADRSDRARAQGYRPVFAGRCGGRVLIRFRADSD